MLPVPVQEDTQGIGERLRRIVGAAGDRWRGLGLRQDPGKKNRYDPGVAVPAPQVGHDGVDGIAVLARKGADQTSRRYALRGRGTPPQV